MVQQTHQQNFVGKKKVHCRLSKALQIVNSQHLFVAHCREFTWKQVKSGWELDVFSRNSQLCAFP